MPAAEVAAGPAYVRWMGVKSRSFAVRGATALAVMCASMLGLLMLPASTFAYHEPYTPGTGCEACHSSNTSPQLPYCVDCHDLLPNPNVGEFYTSANQYAGPHAYYSTTSSKCDSCHSVHKARAVGVILLPEATTWDTCLTCHDGTGGFGVYGAIEQQTGIDPFDADPGTPGGGHLYAATSVVPGGDRLTGGADTTRVFGGPGTGYLICTDCHAVHGASVVDPFVGDRRRLRANQPSIYSTKLLKRRPTTAATDTTRYGSDWCLGCHSGRDSVEPLHNHPVDSTESTFTVGAPWDYGNLPILASDGVTGSLVMSGLGGIIKTGIPTAGSFHQPDPPYASENRGYLMLYPRIDNQIGHAPICQQCHEDARNVGTLLGDGSTADAADGVITVDSADGVIFNDNPRFQNFPHETTSNNMLVETGNDLCLNCHPTARLP